MPYFKRRPYAEREARASDPPPAAREDFLALARAALSGTESADAQVPFRVRGPIRPGGSGAMTLELALEADGPPVAVTLSAGDLLGSAMRIPAPSVRILPPTVTLSPGATIPVDVTIDVPKDTLPGLYAGTVMLAGAEARAIAIEAEIR
jgi:hypothetical protein